MRAGTWAVADPTGSPLERAAESTTSVSAGGRGRRAPRRCPARRPPVRGRHTGDVRASARHAGSARRGRGRPRGDPPRKGRSEEHTSELQSRQYLVCRLLLEKKKLTKKI